MEYGQDGWSYWSTWQSFFTSADQRPVPPQPTPPMVVNVSATAALLNWTVPSVTEMGQSPPIGAYQTSVAQTDDLSEVTTSTVLQGFSPGLVFHYTAANLEPYTSYTFYYVAVNSAGKSSASDGVTFQTAASVPGAPGLPELTNATNLLLSFAWAAAAPNGYQVDEYVLRLCESGGACRQGAGTDRLR